ncbi:MAG: hypothetical protein AABZ74_03545 [Cyanobacteriota bacterium]
MKKIEKIYLLTSIFLLISFSSFAEEKNKKEGDLIEPISNFSQFKFIPDISVILDGSYVFRDKKIEDFNKTRDVKGFGLLDNYINKNNGFNLNYSELAFSSVVDPFFDFFTNFHLSENEFEIEEAFINTRFLPFGLRFKVGKFLSNFGRINSQHAHYWDFNDQPLVYGLTLSEHGLLEKGIQLNWLAPFDFYLALGSEVFIGENEKSFGNKGFVIGKNTFEDINLPNLVTGFAKTSFDIGELTFLGGVSYAQGGTRILEQSNEENSETTALSGINKIFGADLTLKYQLDSYSYLSLQSELIKRNMSGDLYKKDTSSSFSKNQSGLYSNLIYKVSNQWKLGLRYDLIFENNLLEDSKKIESNSNLSRYSAMIEYNTSEFSRFRFQYNHDRVSSLEPVNEFMLNMNISIGAHGAHAF